ncbi:SDR family NAD(P)-dependent oxidoreductase, partial [Maribacter dokdonensis]
MKDLKNKVAYITGGTKGIGFAVAQTLLDQGMKVAISGRSQESVDQALKGFNNDDVLGIVSNVAKLSDEENAVAKITDKWGQVDVVLANAGVGNFAPIDEMTEEQWHQMIDVNLSGVFHTLKASVASLKKTEGYYITLASLAGTNFFAQGAGYNASKF